MRIAVHQPHYLPWLGYFDKMLKADAFCYLDNVQYKKNEWQNRNRIKTDRGWQWLTVPVHYRFPQKICEVCIDNTAKWKHKHLQALKTYYGKAPYFSRTFQLFERVLAQKWQSLSELNIELAEQLRQCLGLGHKTTARASHLNLSEDPTERLIDICLALGGDTYLSGPDGLAYMNAERFRQRGLRIEVQAFEHPVYLQRFGEFISHLSVLDLLCNCGPDSLAVLSGRASQSS
jgi:hypothetical protein